ncbi:hypothetical protein EDD22DRAFT_950407 [Suillus occidentalis]|nr:hypothetical protein EDD22DRAFT_950407 [Suillus occidentalis]
MVSDEFLQFQISYPDFPTLSRRPLGSSTRATLPLDVQLNFIGCPLDFIPKCGAHTRLESSDAFEKLNDTADPDVIERWEAEEKEAQDSHVSDPTAMDMYGVHLREAQSQKEVEIDLLRAAVTWTGERCQLGAATWLASGITIEEMQITLAMEIRRMGRHPTKMQTLEIGRHQVRLQHSIDEFILGATRYLREEFDEDNGVPDMLVEFYEDGPDNDFSDDNARDLDRHAPQDLFRPETAVILLLSNLGLHRCEDLGVMGLVTQETGNKGTIGMQSTGKSCIAKWNWAKAVCRPY